MGYFVWKLGKGWRVVWRDKDGDRHVRQDEYTPIGFKRDMTLSEARQHAKAINAASHMRRAEKTRQKLNKRKIEASQKLAQLYGQEKLDQYENWMRKLYGQEPQWERYMGQWRAAQEWLLAVDDLEEPRLFYRYWEKKPWSLDHGARVLKWLNGYLELIGKNKVPMPRGYTRQRIQDAWLAADKSTESKPLSVEILASAKPLLTQREWCWCFITLWLGLRPNEVQRKWVMEGPHLAVYQSKLKSLPYDQRWKYIRIVEPEQKKAVKLLQSGEWKKPGRKKICSVFGKKYGEYAGRKGFLDLMRSRGHALEAISAWMGHTAPELTARKYRLKNKRY